MSIGSIFYYFFLFFLIYVGIRIFLNYFLQYYHVFFRRSQTEQLVEFYKNHDTYAVMTDSSAPIQGAPITNMGYWKNIKKPSSLISFLFDASKLLRIANLALFDLTYQTAGVSKNDNLVLDVGCAFGIGTFYLSTKYQPKKTIGISISPVEIARCKGTIERLAKTGEINRDQIDFIVADATKKLPFEDNSVDKIVSTEAQFHFDPRENFWAEAYRILKPGSVFGFVDLVTLPSRNLLDRIVLRGMSWSGLYMPDKNTYDTKSYLDRLRKSGFQILEQESILKDTVPPYIKFNVGSRWYWYAIQPECLLSFGFVVYPFDYIRVKAIKPAK